MAAPAPTVVIFDLGGVLIDWDPRYLYRQLIADEREVERFLAEICSPAWNLEADRGRPFAAGIADLVQRHPEKRALIEAYVARWIEMIGGPIEGTVAILEELAARCTRLVALSNWSMETFPLVHGQPGYAFLDRFERLFVSGALGMIKPDQAIFRHVLAELERPASTCLFIDDNQANIDAAGTAGFHVHKFETPDGLRRDLQAHGLLG